MGLPLDDLAWEPGGFLRPSMSVIVLRSIWND